MKLISAFLDTFTNKQSKYSSKRIERFAVFTSMLIATDIYLVMAIFKCSISATDLMIVCGGWLAYAGFNIVQGRKDKDNGENI
jgi:small neutral amino acid transporter SnatA (MarC family)